MLLKRKDRRNRFFNFIKTHSRKLLSFNFIDFFNSINFFNFINIPSQCFTN